ncbi:hypothetical protein BB560_005985, partial [Smittium megazygosporum]
GIVGVFFVEGDYDFVRQTHFPPLLLTTKASTNDAGPYILLASLYWYGSRRIVGVFFVEGDYDFVRQTHFPPLLLTTKASTSDVGP